jgi:hypothetical protein
VRLDTNDTIVTENDTCVPSYLTIRLVVVWSSSFS